MNYEGEAVIKRLTRDAGQWWLSSDNLDQRRFYRKSCRGGECIVVGRVVRRDPVEVWADTPVALPAKSPIILAANDGAMLDAELWPIDCELLAEIHDLFLQRWGMHAGQADIRMARFNYQAARAALEGGAA